MLIIESVFWFCAGLVAYTYLGYPLLLLLASPWRRPVRRGPFTGSFSIVIAARNEQANLGRRVRELHSHVRGNGRTGEIIVVSDGSTDATSDVARDLEAEGLIRFVDLPENVGKAAALGAGRAVASGDILVFADIRQTWDPAALACLLENFADPQVGAVSGELVLESSAGTLAGVGLYWRYEKWLRRRESDLGSMVVVTGAIAAVRSDLFQPVPTGIVAEDLYWPMQIALRGYRVVHDDRARAFDRLPDRPRDEFRRKVRTLAGNFQVARCLPRALLPWRNPVWMQWLSHKVLRLAVPWALLTLLATSALLPGPFYRGCLLAQLAGYAVAAAGFSARVARRSRLASAAASFVVLNAAAFTAFWVWVTGRASRCWHKSRYQQSGVVLEPAVIVTRQTEVSRTTEIDEPVTEATDQPPSTRAVARNVVWNTSGLAVQLLAGFLIAPFLVRTLGETSYGLWILIASLTSYFCNLDIGVGGSLARNLAFYLARKDSANVRGIFSTACALMAVVALLVLLAIPAIVFIFFRLFDVPAEQVDAVHLALLLVCFNLVLSFPLGLFDGTLWAMQRFDLQNAVDIPAVIVRIALTILLIDGGPESLPILAGIVIGFNLLQSGIKIALTFWLEPSLRLQLRAINRQSARTLFDYGVWFVLLAGSRTIAGQIGPTVVGNRLGAALVTPFRIGAQLAAYANNFMVQSTQVLTPVATSLHATNDHERQQSMFLIGGRTCLILALYIAGVFFFLGRPLLTLWVGPAYVVSWTYLMILVAGEILPMSQWISQSLILGSGQHKKLAIWSLAELPLSIALALILVGKLGLVGVCLGLAIPAFLIRGVWQMAYACRLRDISVGRYVIGAFLPGLLFVLPHLTLLGLAASWHTPASWVTLFAYGLASSGLFFGCLAVSLLGLERVLAYLPGKRLTDPSSRQTETKLLTERRTEVTVAGNSS